MLKNGRDRLSASVLVTLTALAGLMSSPLTGARAQTPRDTFRLSEVVVTATRLPTPRAAVTAFVTVISGEELERRGIHSVIDALRDVAGVAVAQTGSTGSLASVFVRGGESDYTTVLVDGVPLNAPGGAVDLAAVTTDNVERIEIVRGPASTLYGSEAVSGVVQIFTRRGRGVPRARAEVRSGVFRSARPDNNRVIRGEMTSVATEWSVQAAGGTEQVNYALGLARQASPGLYTTDGTRPFNNDFRNTVLNGLVRVVPDARTEATLSVRYGDDTYHYPTDGRGQLVDRNAFQYRRSTTISFDAGRYLTRRVEARMFLADHTTDGGTDDQPDDAADTLGFYASESHATVARRRADARVITHLPAATSLVLGAQIEHQRQRGFSAFASEFGPFSSDDDHRRVSRGYYAHLQTDALGAFAVSGGLRLEDNQAFGAHWTARGGLVYRPVRGGGLSVRAAAGSGFKEPTFYENFATGFVRGNPDLRPERSVSAEVGVEHALKGRGMMAITAFRQRFRDLIQFTFSPRTPGDPNFLNVGEAEASGMEFEGRLTATSALELSATYTYLHTEVIDGGLDAGPCGTFVRGRRLLRRPAHAASAGLDARLRSGVRLHVIGRYVGERDDCDFAAVPTPVALASYAAADLAAEWDVRHQAPATTLTLKVENVTGADVRDAFNFAARGTTVWLGARIR
ncbi:MAG TPA: TonB-dependent receptor [Gemmatimonadales bacterium]|nr:TonB-dependent receptor [Gemmatimonadales bacterium]